MSKIEFYDDLSDEPPDTIEMSGMVLMNKNKNKWHLCKKGGNIPTHACGNGGPSDPHRSQYSKGSFERSTEVVPIIEALEQGRLCSFCERIVKKEFDLEQVTVAVGASEREDIERFVKLRDKTLKSDTTQ